MPARRPGRGSRHGREPRSSTAGPTLPLLSDRLTRFEDVAADAVAYVKTLWREELADVQFRWADMPPLGGLAESGWSPDWHVDTRQRVITIYRLPLQRLPRVHMEDAWHRQVAIEGAVFRAAAELLGRDPWEVAPGRWRHH